MKRSLLYHIWIGFLAGLLTFPLPVVSQDAIKIDEYLGGSITMDGKRYEYAGVYITPKADYAYYIGSNGNSGGRQGVTYSSSGIGGSSYYEPGGGGGGGGGGGNQMPTPLPFNPGASFNPSYVPRTYSPVTGNWETDSALARFSLETLLSGNSAQSQRFASYVVDALRKSPSLKEVPDALSKDLITNAELQAKRLLEMPLPKISELPPPVQIKLPAGFPADKASKLLSKILDSTSRKQLGRVADDLDTLIGQLSALDPSSLPKAISTLASLGITDTDGNLLQLPDAPVLTSFHTTLDTPVGAQLRKSYNRYRIAQQIMEGEYGLACKGKTEAECTEATRLVGSLREKFFNESILHGLADRLSFYQSQDPMADVLLTSLTKASDVYLGIAMGLLESGGDFVAGATKFLKEHPVLAAALVAGIAVAPELVLAGVTATALVHSKQIFNHIKDFVHTNLEIMLKGNDFEAGKAIGRLTFEVAGLLLAVPSVKHLKAVTGLMAHSVETAASVAITSALASQLSKSGKISALARQGIEYAGSILPRTTLNILKKGEARTINSLESALPSGAGPIPGSPEASAILGQADESLRIISAASPETAAQIIRNGAGQQDLGGILPELLVGKPAETLVGKSANLDLKWGPTVLTNVSETSQILRGKWQATGLIPAAEANARYVDLLRSPPYLAGTKVLELTLIESDKFVRVHSEATNAARRWIVKEEAIQNLTAIEIQKKLSLPTVPRYVSDALLPAGTRLRRGLVEKNFEGGKGAIQYEIMNPTIDPNWFSNMRILEK
jgi:hypothetical protein